MSAEQTEAAQRPEHEQDPRFRAAVREGMGDKGREMVAHASMGADLDSEEESSALQWLLGNPTALIYDVPVTLDTPTGPSKITWTIQAQDGDKLDEIERRHTDADTGQMDVPAVNLEIVWSATQVLTDSTGFEMRMTDEEFLTFPTRDERGNPDTMKIADPMIALKRRFRTQLGIIAGMAMEVRRVSGYTRERVGAAQRRLVTASGN